MQGKVRVYDEVLCFPAAQDAPKEAHFSLAPSRVLSCELNDGGRKRLREQQIGFLEGITRKQTLLTTSWTMKKPANRSLEIFSLWIPHWPTGTSCAPCAQPHSPPSCSWMYVLAAEGSERQLSQRASELVQKASQSLWAWERPQVAPPLGNQMRHC